MLFYVKIYDFEVKIELSFISRYYLYALNYMHAKFGLAICTILQYCTERIVTYACMGGVVSKLTILESLFDLERWVICQFVADAMGFNLIYDLITLYSWCWSLHRSFDKNISNRSKSWHILHVKTCKMINYWDIHLIKC